MCYSNELQHKGIKIVIGDCFGVGFDWDDEKLREAVENRSESIWEILNWMTNGSAKTYNEAAGFGSDFLYNTRSYSLSMLKHYNKSELRNLLENPYLSKKSRDLIESFFDGSLQEVVNSDREEERKNKKPKSSPGTVYLLRSGEYYKIGKAKSLPKRLDTLAVGVRVPFAIELVHSFKSENYSIAEAYLHSRYAEKRTDGEWFTLSDDEVVEITSIQDNML